MQIVFLKIKDVIESFSTSERIKIKEIPLGLESGVDFSVYAKPVFNEDQMFWIRYGLAEYLKVSDYAKSEFTANEMEDLYRKLRTNGGLLNE